MRRLPAYRKATSLGGGSFSHFFKLHLTFNFNFNFNFTFTFISALSTTLLCMITL